MNDPQPLAHAEYVKELQARVRARGIEVPDQPDYWERVDAEAHAAWQADRDAIRRNVWTGQVPAEFADADLDRIDEVDHANALRAWLPGHDRNVVLSGTVGVGKTYAAYALGNAAVEAGLAPYALTATDLLDVFRPGGDPKVEAWALAADILIVDDLGAEKTTEWTAETWHRITDHRYRNRLPIVVTTNEGYSTLTEKYGDRIVSRLLANRALIVKMTGPDRRRAAFERA